MITKSGFVFLRKRKNLRGDKILCILYLGNWKSGAKLTALSIGFFFEANPTIITLYLEFIERVRANFSYIRVSETGLRMEAMTIDFCTIHQFSF
jgi:hypothetical protein